MVVGELSCSGNGSLHIGRKICSDTICNTPDYQRLYDSHSTTFYMVTLYSTFLLVIIICKQSFSTSSFPWVFLFTKYSKAKLPYVLPFVVSRSNLDSTNRDLTWFTISLQDFGVSSITTIFLCNNQVIVYITSNPSF